MTTLFNDHDFGSGGQPTTARLLSDAEIAAIRRRPGNSWADARECKQDDMRQGDRIAIVPLTINGQPFSCAAYQPKETKS